MSWELHFPLDQFTFLDETGAPIALMDGEAVIEYDESGHWNVVSFTMKEPNYELSEITFGPSDPRFARHRDALVKESTIWIEERIASNLSDDGITITSLADENRLGAQELGVGAWR